MRIVFISDHMKFSGGRRLMFDYAIYLKRKGHDVKVIVEERRGELANYIEAQAVPALDAANIPDCDLIVATSPKEMGLAVKARKGKPVHFCQGIELVDLEQRISGQIVPPRFKDRKGVLGKLKLFIKKLEWRRKLRSFDKIYKLPTSLIAITAPMCRELEKRYKRPVRLCRNGVDLENLRPREGWKPERFGADRPIRILCIGPASVTYKGIPTTMEAVALLRERGIPLELTRLSPFNVPEDKEGSQPFALRVGLPREEFCRELGRNDVYVSNSTEREGFGLPAIESMGSGLVCILSSITAYKSFVEGDSHCIFVPEGDAKATADAIERVFKMPPEEISAMRSAALSAASGFSHLKACEDFEKALQEIYAEGPFKA